MAQRKVKYCKTQLKVKASPVHTVKGGKKFSKKAARKRG